VLPEEAKKRLIRRSGSSPASSPVGSKRQSRPQGSNPDIKINIEAISDASSNTDSVTRFFNHMRSGTDSSKSPRKLSVMQDKKKKRMHLDADHQFFKQFTAMQNAFTRLDANP